MKKKRNRSQRAGSPIPAATSLHGGALAIQARYDAASQGRRMASWKAPSSGPNTAMSGVPVIRNRSRDAGRNEWAGASSSRTMTTNLVGTGIIARPLTKKKAVKEKLTEGWNGWCEVCDADGVLDFNGQTVLATATWFEAGEAFVRLRSRRLSDGLPAPLQIQILEPEFVPHLDADVWPGMPDGNTMRHGIERDKVGRRTAYWMFRAHPGDNAGSASIGTNDLVRVPADQVIHLYRPRRAGQLRGIPESAPILAKLRTVMEFDDNVLTRQQVANLFAMFITRPLPTGADLPVDPLTGKTVQYGSNGAPVAALEPAIAQELLPGEDVKFSTPPDAGANYADFMREQKLGLSAGQGIPYELMTGDIKDVSDRTLRVVINEFRRYCEQIQYTIIIPKFCKPIRAAWANASYLAGGLTEEEVIEANKTTWSPQGWAYIHPVQDVQAKVIEKENGFKARSQIILEAGYEPDEVDAMRAEDKQRELDLDLTQPPPDPAADPVKQAEADKAKKEGERAEAEARLFDAKAAREKVEGDAALIRARADADRLKAEAELAVARSNQAVAEATAAEASADHLRARSASEAALAELREAIEKRESAERIAALVEQRENAASEAEARRVAHEAAEAFAAQQRDLVLAAERKRAETASLELRAAEAGLAELQGA